MRPFLSIRRWHAFTRFSRDARGISAVEFALLLPIMVALYLGGVELTDGLSVQRKVTLTANALVNLAGQTTSITTSDMTNILDAASAVMYPYPSANLTATLTCISIDPSTQQATVRWSVPFPSTGTHYAENQPLPFQINKDLITVKQSDGTDVVVNPNLLLAEVSYAYTPIIGYAITSTINISDRMYMAPRISPPSYGDSEATAKKCTP